MLAGRVNNRQRINVEERAAETMRYPFVDLGLVFGMSSGGEQIVLFGDCENIGFGDHVRAQQQFDKRVTYARVDLLLVAHLTGLADPARHATYPEVLDRVESISFCAVDEQLAARPQESRSPAVDLRKVAVQRRSDRRAEAGCMVLRGLDHRTVGRALLREPVDDHRALRPI